MKTLRRRYIAFEVFHECELDKKSIIHIIHKNYIQLYGEYGLADANIALIDYRENKGVLRTTNKALENTKTVLALIRLFNKKEVRFKILGVSGTIKKCKKKYLELD